MSGDIANPRLWEGADLWTAPLGTTLPTALNTEMTSVAAWKAVGLLSEDGASEGRDEDTSEFFAWGGKLIRIKRSKHKRTIKVTCLEDNLVVFGLVNPGSTVSTTAGVNTRVIKVPKSEKVSFCLELVDGDIKRRRFIPTGEVQEVGEVALSDSDLQAFELTIVIYPDANDVLYQDIDNDPQGAVTETP
jgi:hypothetical protein